MSTQTNTEQPALAAPSGSETIEVWKCTYAGLGHYITDNLGDIMDEICDSQAGDKYQVEKVTMTRAAFDALPEFNGF